MKVACRPQFAHIQRMRLNSPESLETARRLIEEHGTWSAVREASRVSPSGVFVLKPKDPEHLRKIAEMLKL